MSAEGQHLTGTYAGSPKSSAVQATHPGKRWAIRQGGRGGSLGQRPPCLAVQTDSSRARPA